MSLKKCLKIIVLAVLLGCLPNIPDTYAAQIVGSGCSVSNIGYLSAIAGEYERLTGVKVLVRGGGTVVGIEDLRAGRVDFAASCREKTPSDPDDIEFIQVAWDALVFIANKSNPVDDISTDNVRSICEGKLRNWKELKGRDANIKIFRSRPGKGLSGVDDSMRKMVLQGKEPHETPNALSLASTGIVEQMVEKTAEGFAASGFSSACKRDVKMLRVNGSYPNKNNIVNGKYPLRRPLFIIIPKKAKPETKKFVDFVLSKEGQQFISSQGIISLADIK
ncbi:MAG: substrate-binding domain-containing protein [Nitrospirae bacterium]|nr:substrate-binding domain-containing protein [Nitrospirota bacterium]